MKCPFKSLYIDKFKYKNLVIKLIFKDEFMCVIFFWKYEKLLFYIYLHARSRKQKVS